MVTCLEPKTEFQSGCESWKTKGFLAYQIPPQNALSQSKEGFSLKIKHDQ
jgi:hypothetical protein